MRLFVRGAVLVAVFAGVGWLAAGGVLHHAHVADPGWANEASRPQVRLAAAMAGLFAGGAAATLALIAMVRKRR